MVPHGWTHNPCMADTGHTLVFIDTIEAKQTKEQSKDRCNRRLRDSRPKKAKEQQSKGFFAPFLAPSPFWLARCLSLALCIYIHTTHSLPLPLSMIAFCNRSALCILLVLQLFPQQFQTMWLLVLHSAAGERIFSALDCARWISGGYAGGIGSCAINIFMPKSPDQVYSKALCLT